MTSRQDAGPTTVRPLGRVATRAWSLSTVNTAVSRLGTLAIGIVLARLLGPEAFGMFAVATVALVAVLSFNELGVSLAIVRWPGDPARIAPTVTTISVASSTLLTIGALLGAPAFAAGMGDAGATPVVRVMMLCILINGIVATPAALLQRDFAQGRRMVVDQVNVWVGAFVSVGLALAGSGAMSLAIGRIAGTVLSAGLFLRYSPLPLRLGFDADIARRLARFGLPLAGASIIVFLVGYVDQLFVGALLGSTALGFYVLAFNLASWPVSMFSQPLRSVMPAVFARIQHDRPASSAALRAILGVLGSVAIPVCLLLAGAAGPIIAVVYGPAWAAAAPVLTWLAGAAVLRIVFELAYDYLVVLGRTGGLLVIQVVWVVALVPALLLGSRVDGLTGLAAAQIAVALVVVLPLYLVQINRAGVPAQVVLRRLGRPVAGGFVVLGSALVLGAKLSSSVLVCLAAGVTTVLVVAVLLWWERPALRHLKQLSTPSLASATPVSDEPVQT